MNTFTLECSHKPKLFKKIGHVFGNTCEILVCESCRYDSDLDNFEEEKI